jgi:glyoxylate utilization-related uncharacterized protein
MSTTFIDTNSLPRVKTPNGIVTEVLNEQLAGAKNVKAMLHWLNDGESLAAGGSGRHELVYLMEGQASIKLEGKDYDVKKGNGVYLEPTDSATVKAAPGGSVKLFHLVVPVIPA